MLAWLPAAQELAERRQRRLRVAAAAADAEAIGRNLGQRRGGLRAVGHDRLAPWFLHCHDGYPSLTTTRKDGNA